MELVFFEGGLVWWMDYLVAHLWPELIYPKWDQSVTCCIRKDL